MEKLSTEKKILHHDEIEYFGMPWDGVAIPEVSANCYPKQVGRATEFPPNNQVFYLHCWRWPYFSCIVGVDHTLLKCQKRLMSLLTLPMGRDLLRSTSKGNELPATMAMAMPLMTMCLMRHARAVRALSHKNVTKGRSTTALQTGNRLIANRLVTQARRLVMVRRAAVMLTCSQDKMAT